MSTTAPTTSDVDVARDVALRRRVGLIWALLFLNVLSYSKGGIIDLPTKIGQGITQTALWTALLLALMVNRRRVFRLNAFLVICTVLAATSLIVSAHAFHLGPTYRAVRLIGFLATLWLLTPWFGRRDQFLLRCHLRCLIVIVAISMAGIPLSVHKSFVHKRLTGAIWSIPTTQLAHYVAVAIGLILILWIAGRMASRVAAPLIVIGFVALVLTGTRTAMLALVVGVAVAITSQVLVSQRFRRAAAVGLLVVVLGGVFYPVVSHWFVRGESQSQLSSLTGRRYVWDALMKSPRDHSEMAFGEGLTNSSFDGLSIDSSWLAIYQEQGLLGDVLCGSFLLTLLVLALVRARGPSQALALFLVVYCALASYTETGLGDASPYLLDLAAAASLVMPWISTRAALPSPT